MRARLLEDCAHNLRIVYELPTTLGPELLRAAGARKVMVNEFSKLVKGAHDHVVGVFAFEPVVRAEGVVGSRELTVTYGSLAGMARPEAVADLEGRLDRAFLETDDPDETQAGATAERPPH